MNFQEPPIHPLQRFHRLAFGIIDIQFLRTLLLSLCLSLSLSCSLPYLLAVVTNPIPVLPLSGSGSGLPASSSNESLVGLSRFVEDGGEGSQLSQRVGTSRQSRIGDSISSCSILGRVRGQTCRGLTSTTDERLLWLQWRKNKGPDDKASPRYNPVSWKFAALRVLRARIAQFFTSRQI